MSKISVLISQEEISKRLAEMGAQISKDYEGCEELVLVCILKGSVYITSFVTFKSFTKTLESDPTSTKLMATANAFLLNLKFFMCPPIQVL